MWIFNLIIQVQSDELLSSHGKHLQEVAVWRKLENPLLATHLIYFEFRSKPSLITVIWMDPLSPKKNYCDKILFSHTRRWYQFLFLSLFFVFMLCYVIYFVIINFCKNCFLSIIIIIIFLAELPRARSGAPWVRKFGKPSIPENLVMTQRTPVRTTSCKPMSNVTIDLAQLD